MRLFYDTMNTPEMIEFYIELKGRKIIRSVQINTSGRTAAGVAQAINIRAIIEGDRISDVTGFRLYDKEKKMCVQKTLRLPYKSDEAKNILRHSIEEARSIVIAGGRTDE